ncbi:methylenetetrahydrofolate reductase 2 [Xylona heveae TC161]|uniref:Methylenetetrahydrofolate reductase 2 n=1 Tax=Xylona heveae (strain CBS 132557 / TC161) TaxID=1328760 RepID=A0A165ADV6_XYLHT|nr:methylenetetrahydrofolate reductase 2 [Xylona heveae TC161]KZF20315.1 methylenetetrahydrofolate reductase 2 [Xylona heveae TC161]
MEKISEKVAALPDDAYYFSLEFFPPKTATGLSNLQARLERMARALRPLFVTVTWGAGGSTSERSLELAATCQRQLGLTTCLHLTCTNMSRPLIDQALESAKALGIRNILALRGDPPRSNEYHEDETLPATQDSNVEFKYAVDLVRYIRKQYGDYFAIGVAAYPEGHTDESYPEYLDAAKDIPYLVEKVEAGADFILTQLFFDITSFQKFESTLRNHPSGAFKTIPIIPGLMPVQSYAILKRTTKLSHATLPEDVTARLDEVRGDDEAVKRVGVDIISEIVETIKRSPSPGARGFHFYTLNLEKAVAFILERCHLIPPSTPMTPADDFSVVEDGDSFQLDEQKKKERRRYSSTNSMPRNRVVVEHSSGTGNRPFEAPESEVGVPRDLVSSRATTLAISEGEGALGREATWDDFPNGRWGDSRSPAYGEIDGYGPSLHVSTAQATKLWGYPVTRDDISQIFSRHITGELDAIPWSEEALSEETQTIRNELLKLHQKGWWTVASQPAVDGVRSDHKDFGWGPRNGFVFQKAFVEIFLPSADWAKLQKKISALDEVSYFAGNAAGDFVSSDEDAVNAVTWGVFAAKEITTPTIIEKESFKAWLEEAYTIWEEWQRVYPPRSPSAKLLRETRDDSWLISITHHAYVQPNALWDLLLED